MSCTDVLCCVCIGNDKVCVNANLREYKNRKTFLKHHEVEFLMATIDPLVFGQRVRHFRKAAGMTLEDLVLGEIAQGEDRA